MFPTPIQKASPFAQAAYKVVLPLALFLWLLPLIGVAITSVRPASDLAAGNYFGIPSGFGVPGAVAAPRKQALVTIAWVITLMRFGYMLPWAVAVTRRSANATKVGLVSFFLAWTVVGWIVALVMACTGRPRAMQVRYPA